MFGRSLFYDTIECLILYVAPSILESSVFRCLFPIGHYRNCLQDWIKVSPLELQRKSSYILLEFSF